MRFYPVLAPNNYEQINLYISTRIKLWKDTNKEKEENHPEVPEGA